MTDKTRLWRILIALIAAAGPILQYGLTAHDAAPGALTTKTVEFFSYFTILSNILGAVALAAPLVAPASRLALWSEKAGVRAMVATYLTITAVVYHTMLAHQWNPQGLRLAATTIQHTITPAAFLLDVALRGGEDQPRWSVALKALIFPAAFAAWTLLHGALSGFYPYPFMNVAKHGYPAVLTTIVQMGLAFGVICLTYLALLRVRVRMAPAKTAPICA